MKVEITTRHCELPDNLKERVETRMEKLLRFDDRIMDARVVVSLEKNRYNAEAIVKANGLRMVSHAEEESDKIALESVLDRLEAQVKKHRDRTVKRHKRHGQSLPPALPETDGEDDYDPFDDESDFEGLVSEDPGDFKVEMSVAEAVATLRASRREVLGFVNPASQRPMLVFKRRDGNVGIVDIDTR